MSEMRTFLSGLPTRAKILFVAGFIAILAVMAAGGWWVLRPDYVTLAENLRPVDASEIGSALSGWGVPYRFSDGDKTVMVPADQMYSLRMKLVAEGIPKGGSIGFEAFKDSDYGVTEFAQQVNYQRALQGELERTVESMQEVQSARVHLAIHHAGLFEKDQSPSKGSVTLHLRPDAHLGARQVVGIQRLVASAVDGLQPGSVTVLDQGGAVLSGAGVNGDDAIQMGDQAEGKVKLEKSLRAQVSEMLTRALHRDDFTVSVAVQLNYDRVKRVQERLLTQDKAGLGVLVHEKTNSSRPAENLGGGGGQGGTAAVTSRDVEYAHGKVQEEIEQAPGHIQRISVGVVVPGTLTSANIEQLSDVIAAGIGLDPSRGDRIDIAAIAPWAAPEQRMASADAKSDAAKPVPSLPARQRVPLSAGIWLVPHWGYAAMGFVVLLLGVLMGSRMRVHARVSRRLTAAEREATLKQLVQWIEQPERMS